MPFYEYQCDSCNARFEVQQSMFEEPKATCPTCGDAARRIFSASSIIFKGSGFYCTDSCASKHSGANSGDSCPNAKPPESTNAPSCPCAACS